MVEREVAQELAQVTAAKNNVIHTVSQDKIAFHNEHSGKINDQGQKDLQQQAAKEGLDPNFMQDNIRKAQNNLSTKGNDMKQNADKQIDVVEHKNKLMEQGMDKKVQEYEKDRIGRGKTSKVVGALALVPTVGNSGDLNVGGMNSKQKAREYLKGGEKAVQIPSEKSLKPKSKK